MKVYSFAPSCQPSCQERLMEKLDSYFDFGNTKTRFLTKARNYNFCIQERSHISTCTKILKILSFIFFPIALIAFAIRHFLHARLERNYNIFALDPYISPEEKIFITTNPGLISRAAKEAKAPFFTVPEEYRKISLLTTTEGTNKLIFSIDLEKIATKLDVSEIEIPTEDLSLEMSCTPPVRTLLDQLIQTETGAYVSEAGKKKLLDVFLEFLFVSGVIKEHEEGWDVNPWLTLFHYYTKDKKRTAWDTLFRETNLCAASTGFAFTILSQLNALGIIKLPKMQHEYELPRGIYIYWESF